jgi:hypothetical protein
MSSMQPVAERVSGPAVGLIVTAVLGFVLQAMGFLGNVFGISQGIYTGEPDMAALNFLTGTFGMVMNFIGVAIGIVILMGALRMKRLESHGLATAASILAMIPCISPCCLIGLPFGIWALVVLNQPDVKGAFH